MRFGQTTQPIIRERSEHCISRADIDAEALKVLYRLSDAGYVGYLVGGSVRDLLLGRKPKDFDVGTNAYPSDIRDIFRNCFLIGRRFRLAHIIFGKKIIETSTFRRQPEEKGTEEDGLYQFEDNTFGTPEEDAKRRDFTVNGLFYDIRTFAVIDYVGGLEDLEKRTLRCIGDPNVRFREDPVRMMRAARFAARLDFTIDPESSEAIHKYHSDILNASRARVCEEVFRLFTYQSSSMAFRLMWRFRMLEDILPRLSASIDASGGEDAPIWKYLSALDGQPISEAATNGLRVACLYYAMVAARLAEEAKAAPDGRVNTQDIARDVVSEIAERLRIPKAAFATALSMIDLQRRLSEPPRRDTRSFRFIRNEIFAEALALRRVVLTAEGRDTAVADAWQAYHDEERAAWNGPEDDWLMRHRRTSDGSRPSQHPHRRRHRRRGGGKHNGPAPRPPNNGPAPRPPNSAPAGNDRPVARPFNRPPHKN